MSDCSHITNCFRQIRLLIEYTDTQVGGKVIPNWLLEVCKEMYFQTVLMISHPWSHKETEAMRERGRKKERKRERERERERGGCSLSLFLVQGSAEDYWKDLRIGWGEEQSCWEQVLRREDKFWCTVRWTNSSVGLKTKLHDQADQEKRISFAKKTIFVMIWLKSVRKLKCSNVASTLTTPNPR